MLEWLKPALDWFKNSPRYFFAATVASFALLFLPDRFLEPLGLLTFRVEYKAYAGAVLLVSSCFVACDVLIKFYMWGQKEYQHRRAMRNSHRRLEQLTPEEKEILRLYLTGETRTQLFNMENGVVAGLEHAAILYPSRSQGDIFEYPFNIQPWAWDYLKEHPELLEQARPTRKRRS